MGVDELECGYSSQPASDNNNNNNNNTNDLVQTTATSLERIEKQPTTPTTTHVRPFAPAGASQRLRHQQQQQHPQLTTFVGCCPKSCTNSSSNNNNKPIINDVLQVSTSVQDLNDDRPASSSGGGGSSSSSIIINLGVKNFGAAKKLGRLADPKQHQIINHSLESIDSRYSTSSATNEDSQQHQPAPSQEQQQSSSSPPPPPPPHRHAAAASSALAGCSPIEAQLAASTCDLGINLDNSWPGPGQAGHPTRLSMALMNLGGGSGPRIRSSESPLPAKSPAGGGGNEPSQQQQQTTPAATAAAGSMRRTNEPPFMFAGVLASITGSVFFSLSVLCIKLLPNQEGFTEKVKALCVRGVFMSILCGSAILIRRSTFIVRRDELLVNALRAMFGTCGVLGLYCAISYISIGDATALIFSSPIWTSILSHFILKEPLQWLQLLALPASLFGIVLIAHPALIVDIGPLISHHSPPAGELLVAAGQDEAATATTTTNNLTSLFASSGGGSGSGSGSGSNQTALLESSLLAAAAAANVQPAAVNVFDFEHRWPGIVIALGTSLLVSCTYIVLKFRKTTPIQTTTFWFGVCMIVASMVLQASTGWMEIPWTVYEWLLLFGNGVTSWLGQSFLQWAFLYEEAGVLSIVRTLDVAMTFVLSALFLEEEILWTSIVGATIIGLVVVSIMLNEWIKKLTRASNQRKQSSASAAAAATAKLTLELAPTADSGKTNLKQLDCLSLNQQQQQQQQPRPDDNCRGRRSRQSAYTIEAKA